MNDSEKVEQIKKVLKEWLDKQSHERCWYYPDLFNRITDILEIQPTKQPNLPPRKEFEQGCRKYQEEEYKKEQNL